MTLKEFLKKELDKGNFTLDTTLKFKDEFYTCTNGCITLRDAILMAEEDNYLWNAAVTEPLIDKTDISYFKEVLRPFINKYSVIKVVKSKSCHDRYFIEFILESDNDDCDNICLPYIPKNSSMFKKLEPYKCYTIEELGITRINQDGIREFIL